MCNLSNFVSLPINASGFLGFKIKLSSDGHNNIRNQRHISRFIIEVYFDVLRIQYWICNSVHIIIRFTTHPKFLWKNKDKLHLFK